jgi:NADH-quinone oxidoreductase subunit J
LNNQWPFAFGAAVVGFAGMVYIINQVWPIATELAEEMAPAGDVTRALGVALLSPDQYVLPFEVASVLLLGAMVGAIVIARSKKEPVVDLGESYDESE